MADTTYAYVYYFVPLDGDTEEHMNVFLVRKPASEVTVDDISQVRHAGGRVGGCGGSVGRSVAHACQAPVRCCHGVASPHARVCGCGWVRVRVCACAELPLARQVLLPVQATVPEDVAW